MSGRVIQEESSIQLSENTDVIQEYANLDYSDEENGSGSEEDQQMSEANLRQLYNKDKLSKQSKQKNAQNQFHDRSYDDGRRSALKKMFKDYQKRNEFELSPSTRNQTHFLGLHNNRGSQIRSEYNNISKNFDVSYKDKNDYSSNFQVFFNRESKGKSRKEEHLHNYQSKPQPFIHNQGNKFNIDSFLNAHPLPVQNKAGRVFGGQRIKKIYEQQSPIQQESITLITLPEIDSQNIGKTGKKHRAQANKSKCSQSQDSNSNFEWRFNEARLGFIDTFMPEALKIKSNPYALLKYIQSKDYA